jgi:hypothetical protein
MWRRKKQLEVESQVALQESLQHLKLTEQRLAPAQEVSNALRTLRERNHFAEQLQSIMGGPK